MDYNGDYLIEAKCALEASDTPNRDRKEELLATAQVAAMVALVETLQEIKTILEKIADENRRGRFQRKSWWE